MQDYATSLAASEEHAMEWLYGQRKATKTSRSTLPEWVFAFSELLTHETRQGRTITKVCIQQLIEVIGDRRDMHAYQYSS